METCYAYAMGVAVRLRFPCLLKTSFLPQTGIEYVTPDLIYYWEGGRE